MSETILVALITMAAGVFGAGIGAVMSLAMDNKGAKRRIREEKLNCYVQLLSAYEVFCNEVGANPEYPGETPPEKERQLFVQFQVAHTNALLICEDSSVVPLGKFFNPVRSIHLRTGSPSDLYAAYLSVLAATRNELRTSKK